VLIIGDYTARVGGPSGRSRCARCGPARRSTETPRPYPAPRRVKIIDPERPRAPQRRGLDMREEDLCRWPGFDGSRNYARARPSRNRSRAPPAKPIPPCRDAYPLLRLRTRWRSIGRRAGGTDSTSHMLGRRDAQQATSQASSDPHDADPDGDRRASSGGSKSSGNYVGVRTRPRRSSGKVMSIPDEVMRLVSAHPRAVRPDEHLGGGERGSGGSSSPASREEAAKAAESTSTGSSSSERVAR